MIFLRLHFWPTYFVLFWLLFLSHFFLFWLLLLSHFSPFSFSFWISRAFSLLFYSCFLSCDAYRLCFLSSFSFFVSLPFYLSCDVFPFSSFLVLLLFALFQPPGCYLLLLPSALLFDLLLHLLKAPW